jgi:crotonobetainyl-CoA:carnitine CoA-transferase CaiB-like acyl-CoA transferase
MQIEDDLNGSIPGVASPLRLGATPPQASSPPPRLGAHSRAVLRDLLAMDETRIDRLVGSGVIAEPS